LPAVIILARCRLLSFAVVHPIVELSVRTGICPNVVNSQIDDNMKEK